MRHIVESIAKGTEPAYGTSIPKLKRLAMKYGNRSAAEVFAKERRKCEQKVAKEKAQA
jgi:hypothetical protein